MTDNKTTPIETINTHFNTIHSSLSLMVKETKGLQEEMKLIQKNLRQNDKINKYKKKKPQIKLCLSNELENFLSVDNGTKLTKAEVMKQVSTYIKTKDLQIKVDKRKFKPNKELSKIFGITKNAPQMTFVEINKYVSHHLSK